MMSTKKEIPIFFTVDDKYAPYLGPALYSLISNASEDYHYPIYIIYDSLCEENKEKLLSIVEESAAAEGCSALTGERSDFECDTNLEGNRKEAEKISDLACSSILDGNKKESGKAEIHFVKMTDTLQDITDREENRLRCDYFTLTIYFRLFIPDMFPQYDKGIYLDSDIVVPGDISQMYQIDLHDNVAGACVDHSIEDNPKLVHYLEGAIGVGKTEYINSGILLLNMKKMRELNVSGHFLHLLNTYHFDCVAPDQDYLNAMCKGRILYMDRKWDVMPNPLHEPEKDPWLIHYNLFDKPWCYDNIQYEDYFWQYARETVFYEELVELKRNYSEQQKKQDAENMNYLVEKADRLADDENTFRQLQQNGVKIKV